MARKKQRKWSFPEALALLRRAGVESMTLRRPSAYRDDPELPSVTERVQRILDFLEQAHSKKATDMFCFIMYDITDNKIRNYLAKYLLRQGCMRVQKSVFLAQLKRNKYREMVQTLTEVNDMYDNNDSIFIVPIGESDLMAMSMIGRNVDYSMVVENPGTLFI
jgi:CRISPR-associated protein Cas2